ncbi:MAG: hypothetical protein Q8O43_03990 [Dehalococcoidia bacterium]|nr:hypothetical protein [Dehalococcoidia bacterium]
MPEKEIITLDEAQTAAEKFLQERLPGLKKLAIERVKLASIEGIVVYDVEGIATIGGFLFRHIERPFKIQVAAVDGAIVGYET